MKKPIRLPHSSFINGINIDKSFCDTVINHFKSNIHKAKPGRISNNKLSNIIEKDYTKAIKEYEKKYKDVRNLATYSIIENPRIQYYKKGWGFKQWHCERNSHINRVFVWMVYLNDVKDGGTEFKYQKLKIPAKKGLFLMWPSDFTHTHRGIVSKTKEKYILTGWLGWKV